MPERDHPLDPDDDQNTIPRRGADDVADVRAAIAGDDTAFARLYDRWFDRVHDLAYRILRDHQLAADVAQDAFLSSYRNIATLTDPYAFGGWLLRIARNRAYDRSERERRAHAVDDTQLAIIERGGAAMNAPSGFAVEDRLTRATRPEEAVEDDELVALVWDAADALGERDREVLDLHLRHGLDPAEIAEVIGVNRNAANQTLHRVRQRLATAIASRVLWRSGAPQCDSLRDELDGAGRSAFDAETVRLVDRHASDCEVCDERRRTRLDPAVLFSAIPMVSFAGLKARVAAALVNDGVPMGSIGATPSAGDTSGQSGADGTLTAVDGDASDVPSRTDASSQPETPAELDTPADADAGQRRRGLLAGALVALFIVGVSIVFTLLPRGAGDDVDDSLPVGGATVATATSPTSPVLTATTRDLASATTLDPRGASTTSAAPIVAPTVVPTVAPTTPLTAPPTAAPTTTTPPNPMGTLTISRVSVSMPGYSTSAAAAPLLRWSTTDVADVSVSGPNFSSAASDGEDVVCPGIPAAGYCTLTPSIGTVTYTLLGYDASGDLVVERNVTLTVTV